MGVRRGGRKGGGRGGQQGWARGVGNATLWVSRRYTGTMQAL